MLCLYIRKDSGLTRPVTRPQALSLSVAQKIYKKLHHNRCVINIKNLRILPKGGGRPLRPSLNPPLLMHLRNWRSQIWCKGWMCKSQPIRTTKCPWLGRGQVMWPITKFWGSNHITGTAKPKVVEFCRQCQFYATGWHITNKFGVLWTTHFPKRGVVTSRDPF